MANKPRRSISCKTITHCSHTNNTGILFFNQLTCQFTPQCQQINFKKTIVKKQNLFSVSFWSKEEGNITWERYRAAWIEIKELDSRKYNRSHLYTLCHKVLISVLLKISTLYGTSVPVFYLS